MTSPNDSERQTPEVDEEPLPYVKLEIRQNDRTVLGSIYDLTDDSERDILLRDLHRLWQHLNMNPDFEGFEA